MKGEEPGKKRQYVNHTCKPIIGRMTSTQSVGDEGKKEIVEEKIIIMLDMRKGLKMYSVKMCYCRNESLI